ncbi:UNVERIFIED_ORG: hypothetical protein ABIB63_002474 [Xanthomonas axonopodis]
MPPPTAVTYASAAGQCTLGTYRPFFAFHQVLGVRAIQAGIVAAGGDEADALRVALLEDRIEHAKDGGGVLAVIGRGEDLFAEPERGTDHVGLIVLHDLSVTGQDGIDGQIGDHIQQHVRARCAAKRHVHIERCLARRSAIAILHPGLGTGHIAACIQGWIGVVGGIAAEALVVEHRGDVGVQHVAADQHGDRAAASVEPLLLAWRTDHRLVGRIAVGLLEIVVPIAGGAIARAVAGVGGQHARVHACRRQPTAQAGDGDTVGTQRGRQLQRSGSRQAYLQAGIQISHQRRGKQPLHAVGIRADMQGWPLLYHGHVCGLQGGAHLRELRRRRTKTPLEFGRRQPLVVLRRQRVLDVGQQRIQRYLVA